MNAVMNTRVPQNEGISGLPEKLLDCQDDLLRGDSYFDKLQSTNTENVSME